MDSNSQPPKMKCNFQPYEGPEPFIFISYAHNDAEVVAPILEEMNRRGCRIWYDEGIEFGAEFPASIQEHIENCAVFVPLHSANSAKSKNCRSEINFAFGLDNDKPIISIYLEPVKLKGGLEMRLSGYQRSDYYQYAQEDQQKFYDRFLRNNFVQPCRRSSTEVYDDEVRLDSSAPVEDTQVAYIKDALTQSAAKKNHTEPVPKSDGEGKGSKRRLWAVVLALVGVGACVWIIAASAAREGSLPDMAGEETLGETALGLTADGQDKSAAEAFEWFKKKAEAGNVPSMVRLGNCYYYGDGVEKDGAEACRWYKQAPEAGNAAGMYALGNCYYYGVGADVDGAEAFKWYRQAAEADDPRGMVGLGNCYY